ncbi:Protein of unknown function [Desulfatibacillum alkenivorans DSM 16219]|jgi:hypothetical protein|uniref:DUF3089 domain-containing protein n=1 Tax=Desulfatibacillum alkenivorans DSM 16219 TaxID=1121393 RepID=A0A1M6FBZ7_9BACT|nr:DUF3089 domain-containing protein [Desulfatibacillum alkenivorans]SHI95258.1 Protein of unknown function [Desulfatibacillum alkenivorans DSM 16219]
MKSSRKNKFFLILTVFLLLGPFFAPPALAEDPSPDYSQKQNWLALAGAPDKEVDVFWVYPTVYQGKPLVAAIDDPQMRQAAMRTLTTQASVFAESANIFAPMYRQVQMAVLKMSVQDQEKYLDIGYKDIEKAFDYYLKDLNQGRPFILAGHSQGSDQLSKLIKKRLNDPDLKSKLVAAYIIGWSITRQDLESHPYLQLCASDRDTGCIITYNCVAAGKQKAAPTILPGAVVVNPLSWNLGGAAIAADQNLGAAIFADNGKTSMEPGFTGAQAVEGGLVVNPRDAAKLTSMPFGPGVYHNYDYALFYQNLKVNLERRIKAYLSRGK